MKAVTADHHSLSLTWEGDNDDTPISGYLISYKSNQDNWEELKITGKRSRHVLENLRCGTKYQVTVTAFNPAGRSKPSDLVAAATAGNGQSGSLSCPFLSASASASRYLSTGEVSRRRCDKARLGMERHE